MTTSTDATHRPADAGKLSTNSGNEATRQRGNQCAPSDPLARIADAVIYGTATSVGLFCVALVLLALVSGCAQSTATPVTQTQGQEQVTPTTAEADQATQGTSINFWMLNGPGPGGTPATPLATLGDGGVATLLGQINGADDAMGAASAGYVQGGGGGIHVTITTGGTTPTQTGTATGTATAAANPAATQTTSPTQQVEPDVGIAMPVGVAPGGIVDQNATASGGGGSASSEKTGSHQLTTAQIEFLKENYPEMWPFLEAMLADKGNGLTTETQSTQSTE